MYQSRRSIFPIVGRSVFAVRVATLFVSLVFLGELTGTGLPAQEAAPQTEDQKEARQALSDGVRSFKNGQYGTAIWDFQRAKHLDPGLMNARLYLATAYAAQYIPGAPGEANQELGRQSVEEFRGVLDLDPQNLSAMDGIGSLLFQMAGTPYDPPKLEESKSFHQKHIQIKPSDPEPYYWVGVIDWTLSFRANNEFRTRYNQAHLGSQVKDTEPLPPDARQEYVREYGSVIDEGIESLKHAIGLRPNYDDAMAYLNLLYRRKADTAESQDERDELLKMADDLIDRVKEIKQKRAEGPQP